MQLKWWTVLFVMSVFVLTSQAQNAVLTAFGNASGNNGSIDYSVGQMVYTSGTTTDGTMYQGVQVPYEVFIVSSVEKLKTATFAVSLFPNPVSDVLVLNTQKNDLDGLLFHLYDNNGKLCDTKNVVATETNIEMQNYTAGIYFLQLFQNKQMVESFKIIKH